MPAKKLVLIVIDGLTPAVLEQAVEERAAPALAFLAEHGDYRRAVTTFPSLTPVCLSSLATGAHPDVHHIPHLVWYHAAERRLVEYGSSFGAIRAAGTTRSIRDAIFNLNAQHLSPDAVTVFESLDDAGLETAAVNMVCYRGRSRHRATLPGVSQSVYGPRRFFYFNLFESDVTGAPLAVRTRSRGSVDEYAARVGRWLVTRDGFDFFLFYLPDYDFASHASGPDGARAALERTDRAVGALLEAAGGPDAFLERYAVLVCSDHGQTNVSEAVRLEDAFADFTLLRPGRDGARAQLAVTASNRAAMVYALPGAGAEPAQLARRAEHTPGVEVVLFREENEAVARRRGEEVRFAPNNGGFALRGDEALLQYPDALERAWAALANPNAGDLIVSAAPGFEFVDLGGRHHAGGGSHGSLEAGDSEVPMLAVGLDPPHRLVDVAPTILRHFGVEPPAYAPRAFRVA